jgi:hypothetical protein
MTKADRPQGFASSQADKSLSVMVIRAALTYLQHVRYPFISDLKSTLQTPV